MGRWPWRMTHGVLVRFTAFRSASMNLRRRMLRLLHVLSVQSAACRVKLSLHAKHNYRIAKGAYWYCGEPG